MKIIIIISYRIDQALKYYQSINIEANPRRNEQTMYVPTASNISISHLPII